MTETTHFTNEELTAMTNYQHQLSVMIAETLEKLQPLNPDLYGLRYTQLYSNHDDWTVDKLYQLEQDLIDNSHD